MHVTVGSLQINVCTIPTFRVTLQANLEHFSTLLNYIVRCLPYNQTRIL